MKANKVVKDNDFYTLRFDVNISHRYKGNLMSVLVIADSMSTNVPIGLVTNEYILHEIVAGHDNEKLLHAYKTNSDVALSKVTQSAYLNLTYASLDVKEYNKNYELTISNIRKS